MTTEIKTTEENQLAIVAEKSGIEISKAQSYAMKFAPYMRKVSEVSEQAKVINYVEPADKDAQLARELRLQLVRNRTASDGIKEENKRAILIEGRLIDSLYNVVKHASELTEGELMKVEKHREQQIANERAKLKHERTQSLIDYCDNPEMFDLANMSEQAFNNLLTGQKLAHEAKIEVERKAEADRIKAEELARIEAERIQAEYDAEQARIKLENDRLKKEAEEKEAALKLEREENERKLQAERDRAAKEKKEFEAAEKAKRDKLDKEIEERRQKDLEEAKKMRQQIQDKLDKERAEKEAVEKSLLKQREAESNRIKQEEERVQAELAKGDSEKFEDLIKDLEALKEKYNFKSTKYKKLKSSCTEMLNKAINYLIAQNK